MWMHRFLLLISLILALSCKKPQQTSDTKTNTMTAAATQASGLFTRFYRWVSNYCYGVNQCEVTFETQELHLDQEQREQPNKKKKRKKTIKAVKSHNPNTNEAVHLSSVYLDNLNETQVLGSEGLYKGASSYLAETINLTTGEIPLGESTHGISSAFKDSLQEDPGGWLTMPKKNPVRKKMPKDVLRFGSVTNGQEFFFNGKKYVATIAKRSGAISLFDPNVAAVDRAQSLHITISSENWAKGQFHVTDAKHRYYYQWKSGTLEKIVEKSTSKLVDPSVQNEPAEVRKISGEFSKKVTNQDHFDEHYYCRGA